MAKNTPSFILRKCGYGDKEQTLNERYGKGAHESLFGSLCDYISIHGDIDGFQNEKYPEMLLFSFTNKRKKKLMFSVVEQKGDVCTVEFIKELK